MHELNTRPKQTPHLQITSRLQATFEWQRVQRRTRHTTFEKLGFPGWPILLYLHIIVFGLLFYPEDGGSIFLRNICTHVPNCMSSHARRE
jgi:hypothetical protein